MVVQDININIQPVLTKEQVAYEEALKNVKYAAARLKISRDGVDIDNVSQERLEAVIKLIGEIDDINMNFNIEAQKIQQDANDRMKTLQEDANKKFLDTQNKYRELIGSMNRVDITNQEGCFPQTCGTNMSKEKEEELRRMLAQELENAKDTKA